MDFVSYFSSHSCSYFQFVVSEARVLGLGPRFMSVYIPKFGVSTLLILEFPLMIFFPPYHFTYYFSIDGASDIL